MTQRFMVIRDVAREVYTVPQAALALKTAKENVYALISLGKINTLNIGNKAIPKSELRRFIQENLNKDLSNEIAEYKEKKNATKE